VGQRVKARYKGKASYYDGEVTLINADGTLNIKYVIVYI
jgi:hypothetical protein